MKTHGWRVMIVRDADTFMQDQLKVFMAYRDSNGIATVNPLVINFNHPVEPAEVTPVELPEPTVIPTELAEELFEQLGYYLLGVGEPLREIMRLRAELKIANSRVDALIKGFGQLGGKDG